MRKPVFGAVQSQNMPRGLKFRIYEEEVLYYPCSENKGADQLRGHREADLRLCFPICKKPVFSKRGSFNPLVSGIPNLMQGFITITISLSSHSPSQF